MLNALGMIAGPLYVLVSLAEVLLRPGFDPNRHAWSMLANGSWGWVHVANLIISGALVVAGAAGLRARLRGPAIGIGLYGLGLIAAGVFRADPGQGFPPGTPDDAATVSWHGIAHLASGGVGFIGLVVAALLVARRFAPDRAFSLFSAVTGVVFLATFVALAGGGGASWTLWAFSGAVILASAWLTVLFARVRTPRA
ncbi:DUF998 domain-containing protein [Catenuloplanes japonicus]|uniref:DUF998 domain-containing protein n=1 Tax=Catenuloplanes japonicus TaxID=33876 RepID=UPI0005246740|nr:DUF998 domain-containing protein [Catenuloplanes japonicus]